MVNLFRFNPLPDLAPKRNIAQPVNSFDALVWRVAAGIMAEIIQQKWFKRANPAKACFREDASTSYSVIIDEAFAESNAPTLKGTGK